MLLFGKDETIKSCLPAYKTDAIYRIDNLDRYDDREDIRTNLLDSFDKLVDFVCRHTDDKFFLDGTQRISVRGIIAREIVSNILMHREYSSPFPAKLIIEKDKILTENANKTYHYGRIQADSFTPYPKNPIIANFFNNIGRADELGSGVRNLYKYTKIYADSEPLFFEDDIFKIEVPLVKINFNGDTSAITGDKPSITGDKSAINNFSLNTQEKSIVEFITKNNSINTSQVCAILDLKPSRARDLLGKMVNRNLIIPMGANKNRIYLLSPEYNKSHS